MVIQIATLGTSENVVREGVKKYGAEKVIIVAGKPISKAIIPENEIKKGRELKNPVELANILKKDLESTLNIKVDVVEVNPFDFQQCLTKLIMILREIPREKDRIINLTGGTNVMSGAAVCAAWVEGVKAFYLREIGDGKESKEMGIPILKDKKITEKETLTLLHLLYNENKVEERIVNKVAKAIKVRPNTFSTHLAHLIDKGLVETVPYTKEIRHYKTVRSPEIRKDGKLKVLNLTRDGKFYADLAEWESKKPKLGHISGA